MGLYLLYVTENQYGQEIGDDLGQWEPPEGPPEHTELKGQYVTLEPLVRTSHAIPLFHVFKRSQTKMWTYLPKGPFVDAAELGQLIDELNNNPTTQAYAAVVNDEPLGFLTQMHIRPEEGVLEIGWVTFSTELQRTRESSEALFLLLKDAFDHGFRRVEWKTDNLNEASREAAERVGFTEEGVFLKATHYKGRNRDTAWFGITDDVWPEIEEGFGKWLDPSNFDENGEQKERLGH